MPIANEDFQDSAFVLTKKLRDQLQCDIIGCVMFFLTQEKDGNNRWISVHNYNGKVTDVNMLYLYDSVCRHIQKDFLDKVDQKGKDEDTI